MAFPSRFKINPATLPGRVRPDGPTVPAPPKNPPAPAPAINSTPGSATLWIAVNLTVPRIYTRLTAMQQTTFVLESPWYVVEGESYAFTLTYEGATSVTSPSAAAYKDESAVTNTIFPTNLPSASGNVVTLSPATGFTGGERYVVAVTATVDGATVIKKIVFVVSTPGQE